MNSTSPDFVGLVLNVGEDGAWDGEGGAWNGASNELVCEMISTLILRTVYFDLVQIVSQRSCHYA